MNIEARWYGSLEEMGGPLVVDTGTEDILEAIEFVTEYETKHTVLERESCDLYRGDILISWEEIDNAIVKAGYFE